MITKKAQDKQHFARTFQPTQTAREAWYIIIQNYKKENPGGKVLLPSYIGWSPNEGSGIFDSVLNSAIEFEFYALDEKLQIDFEDFKTTIASNVRPLILLVHYFGLLDHQYDKICNWLRENDHFFVEDCAHAMLSDLIGGVCGRQGKYAFYSLHKILPLDSGGVLVTNNPKATALDESANLSMSGYDFYGIAMRRKENYLVLSQLLKNVDGIEVIVEDLKEGIFPQTLPIIIKSTKRDELYHQMNARGFGVVSLYHTMIDQLKNTNYRAAVYTSKHIMNLPIHQDADEKQLQSLVSTLKELL